MLLKELTQAFGVSGFEDEVSQLIITNVKEHADEVFVDALKNVIVLKKGKGINKKKIMIASHMDEIGFMVLSITDKGYLKVRNIGGISIYMSVFNKVKFRNGIVGIVDYQDSIAEAKGNDIGKLYIDIGAKSKEDALRYIAVGEPAAYVGDYVELPNNRVCAKAMDDRVGCYVAIEALKKLGTPYNDVYFVFSALEEVGLRGSKVAAQRIKPDIGVAIDITGSYDTPQGGNGNMMFGQGAAIKIMDNSVICSDKVVESMIETAQKYNIKYQLDVLPSGGTDAGAINQSNEGVLTGGISIPTRYGHSPVSMVDMFDVNCCIELVTHFVDKEFKF